MNYTDTIGKSKDSRSQEYVSWNSYFDMILQFEIDTNKIASYLPKRIRSLEVRPGKSLLSVGVPCFKKGNLGYLPEFHEIFWGVIVQPSYSRQQASFPRSAYYTVNVSGDSDGFLEYAYSDDKMPIYENANLKIRHLTNPVGVEAEDAHGPIFSIRNTQQNLFFEAQNQVVQVYSSPDRNNEVFSNTVQWIGSACQHQKKGNWGKLYNHPFFMGLNVESLSETDCYMQIVSKPDAEIEMRFFTPEKI